MKTDGNKTIKTVPRDRHWVSEVFTSELVMKTIKEKGIELINYRYQNWNSWEMRME